MKKILLIGSVACDEIIRLKRSLRVGGHNQGYAGARRIGGGAANTALALSHANDRVSVLSAVANDTEGVWLLAELERHGIDTALIRTDAQVTTHSLVFLDETGERTIVNRHRAKVALPQAALFQEFDVIYVRSADPSLSTVLASCVSSALVVAHIPPVARGFRPAQVLVGSADDLEPAFFDSPWAAGRRVAGPDLQWVVVTRGSEGVTAYGERETLNCGAPEVTAVDTIGAGDVFAAGLLQALANDLPMEQALSRGAQWGAASVRYEGTIPPQGFPNLP